MKLHHTAPCKECPWRKNAPKGWTGGIDPEWYADAVAKGEVPACHMKDFGPDSDKTAFCAGALSCMANQAMVPLGRHAGQEDAPAARTKVGPNPDVFFHHAQFYEYHADEAYVPLVYRMAGYSA